MEDTLLEKMAKLLIDIAETDTKILAKVENLEARIKALEDANVKA